MKILVAIAYYGTKNRGYLERLLAEYRAMPHDVRLVVVSEAPKDLPADVEVVVGLPSSNPWSLPFAHRKVFAERADDYDLFIYSEDDTLVTERNVRAFLDATEVLNEDEIAGFLRTERDARGTVYFSGFHSHFYWDAGSIVRRGGDTFAFYSNEHAACYLLTRAQLRRAIDSGGFLVAPYEGDYDMLCAAATDPYTRCGMRKLINVSRVDDFLLPHLANRYMGQLGLTEGEVRPQFEAILGWNGGWTGPLYGFRPRVLWGRWSKDLWERPDPLVLGSFPRDARRVLVVGAGWGTTEAEMARRGAAVTVVPVEPVLGRLAASRGLEVVSASLADARRALSGRAFDTLVFPWVLHLAPDPVALLRSYAELLLPRGRVIATAPNHGDLWSRARRIRRKPGDEAFGALGRPFSEIGVHRSSPPILARWATRAGLAVDRVVRRVPAHRKRYSKLTLGVLDGWIADELTLEAKRPA